MPKKTRLSTAGPQAEQDPADPESQTSVKQSLLINVRRRSRCCLPPAAALCCAAACVAALQRALRFALLPERSPVHHSPPVQFGNAKYEQSILRAAGGLEWKPLVEQAAAKFREAGACWWGRAGEG